MPAYGVQAGLIALAFALVAIVGVMGLLISGLWTASFPVMIVLGPLMVGQYLFWRWRAGVERTMYQHLNAGYPPAFIGSYQVQDLPDNYVRTRPLFLTMWQVRPTSSRHPFHQTGQRLVPSNSAVSSRGSGVFFWCNWGSNPAIIRTGNLPLLEGPTTATTVCRCTASTRRAVKVPWPKKKGRSSSPKGDSPGGRDRAAERQRGRAQG